MTKSSKIPRITLIITFLLNGSVSAARFGFQRTILSSLCYCTSTTLLLWVVTWASPRLYVDSTTPSFGKPCLAMCTASSRHAPHVNRLNHLATNRLASFSLCQFLRGYGKIYHSISFPACRHHTTVSPNHYPCNLYLRATLRYENPSLLPFPKEQRTIRLNSFVSPFSLVKEFKRTQFENSFDSSLSLIQKCSKD